jgi:ABC-2 type transport system ATP-binding protein
MIAPERPASDVCAALLGVTHRYGEMVALRDVSLEIRRGEVFALLGHNGAGKTTTVRLLNGLLEPASGEVRVFGRSPTRDGVAVRRQTAVLTEESTLDERLTARETLALFAELFDVPPPEVPRRCDELLAMFDLTARADDRVAAYSKGMKQRLSLARALLHRPALLYLDEPTAGLDPVATSQLHQLVRRMSRDEGRTVVLCTHNLNEAQALSDRVAVLARGAVLAIGTPGELARRLAPRLELEVEVDAARADDARAALAGLDGVTATRVEGGVLRVRGGTREVAPEVAARLAARRIPLYRLEPREPSLADAYFALQGVVPGEAPS